MNNPKDRTLEECHPTHPTTSLPVHFSDIFLNIYFYMTIRKKKKGKKDLLRKNALYIKHSMTSAQKRMIYYSTNMVRHIYLCFITG